MLLHISTLPTILIDIAAWLVIHMGVSYLITHIPLSSFDPESWFYKKRRWEKGGKIYDRVFLLKRWKKRLPDGAALFKEGLEKKHIKRVDNVYLDNFVRDTCRAELIHWIILLFGPVFLVWNLWWVGIVMVMYALSVNMPCIITQRYNRIRLQRVLSKRMALSVAGNH